MSREVVVRSAQNSFREFISVRDERRRHILVELEQQMAELITLRRALCVQKAMHSRPMGARRPAGRTLMRDLARQARRGRFCRPLSDFPEPE